MSVSKKIRFEVFKTDGFSCAYCGGKPPAIVLEADHIEPVSSGGSDNIGNLITSCFNCNRGKGATKLSNIPPRLEDEMDLRREKEEQIKEFRKLMSNIRKRTNRDIKKIDKIYNNSFPDWHLSDSFSQITVKRFLSMLPLHEVEDAMLRACSKPGLNEDRALRYFCGICWRRFDEGVKK